MDNRQQIISLIKSISGQPNVLTIPRAYIALTKSHRAALFLSQSVYWSDRGHSQDGWFYKSYRDWRIELGLNQHAVETCVKALKAKELIVTKVAPGPGTQLVTWYRVNMDALADQMISTLAELAKVTLAESANVPKRKTLMSTYTKTTTKTTKQAAAGAGPSVDGVLKLYSDNIGIPTPIILSDIRTAFQTYGGAAIEYAINEAVRSEARRWSYIEAILKRVKEQGYESAPARAARNGKGNAANGKTPTLQFTAQQTNQLLALNMSPAQEFSIIQRGLDFSAAVTYVKEQNGIR